MIDDIRIILQLVSHTFAAFAIFAAGMALYYAYRAQKALRK